MDSVQHVDPVVVAVCQDLLNEMINCQLNTGILTAAALHLSAVIKLIDASLMRKLRPLCQAPVQLLTDVDFL